MLLFELCVVVAYCLVLVVVVVNVDYGVTCALVFDDYVLVIVVYIMCYLVN